MEMIRVCKTFRKTNISYPLIQTRTCAYQGLRNVSFSENVLYVLNEWFPTDFKKLKLQKAEILERDVKSDENLDWVTNFFIG